MVDGDWWFSCSKFTVRLAVREGKIVREGTAPIVHRFVGQHPSRLANWVRSWGEKPDIKALALLNERE